MAYLQQGAKIFIKDASGEYSEELYRLAAEIGEPVEELYNMKNALASFDSSIKETDALLHGLATS
jgi:hypothetical protein